MSKELLEIPLNAKILSQTPPEVVELIKHLLERVTKLEAQNRELLAQNAVFEKRIVELESRLNRKSTNSNKPPSSDSPFDKKQRVSREKEEKGTRKGYERKRLEPSETQNLMPGACLCGCTNHVRIEPYYTHQVVELPEIKLTVEDIVLYRAQCVECGKTVRVEIPQDKRTGYGPRLSAMIVELTGIHGDSRRGVQDFLFSLYDLSVSLGVIQKIINRAKEAITPYYEAIRDVARQVSVNHIDETSWKTNGSLRWLWAMISVLVSFFVIHKHRSRVAFEELIGTWQGILVSDAICEASHISSSVKQINM